MQSLGRKEIDRQPCPGVGGNHTWASGGRGLDVITARRFRPPLAGANDSSLGGAGGWLGATTPENPRSRGAELRGCRDHGHRLVGSGGGRAGGGGRVGAVVSALGKGWARALMQVCACMHGGNGAWTRSVARLEPAPPGLRMQVRGRGLRGRPSWVGGKDGWMEPWA